MKDEAIIVGISSGDPEAMAFCMRKYSRLLWKVASAVLQNVGCDQDTEEVVADVFVALWEKPERFDLSRGKLKTILCVTARNRAIDRYRSLCRRQTIPLEEAVLSEELGLQEAVLRAETRRELLEAVRELEQPGRDILVRRYYHDQNPREIAVAMGMTVKQVNNSLYRSKQRLRRVLEEKIGGAL